MNNKIKEINSKLFNVPFQKKKQSNINKIIIILFFIIKIVIQICLN